MGLLRHCLYYCEWRKISHLTLFLLKQSSKHWSYVFFLFFFFKSVLDYLYLWHVCVHAVGINLKGRKIKSLIWNWYLEFSLSLSFSSSVKPHCKHSQTTHIENSHIKTLIVGSPRVTFQPPPISVPRGLMVTPMAWTPEKDALDYVCCVPLTSWAPWLTFCLQTCRRRSLLNLCFIITSFITKE